MSEPNPEHDPSQQPVPTERAVRIHAVKEGVVCALSLGAGTFFLTVAATEAYLGTEKVEKLQTEPENVDMTLLDNLAILAPFVTTALVSTFIYRKISSRIRRRGGSLMIGFRNADDAEPQVDS